MPKKSKKKDVSINITAIITRVISVLFFIGFIYLSIWLYINVYKPDVKRFVRYSRYAYREISNVIYDIYKQKGYVYDKPDEPVDSVCRILAEKLSDKTGSCAMNNTGMPQYNFTIKNSNIEIYGLERKGETERDGNIIKEFIIDIDGEKEGPNEIGKDRVPVQIHSRGRMAGRLMPVNCNVKDYTEYGMPIGKSCTTGIELNFLSTNVPFGFDINQIGSKEGKIVKFTRDVPFLRADCAAFGGEIIADEYCEDKGIYWLKRCYHEYYCGFEPSK